jgi:hypothetical protein
MSTNNLPEGKLQPAGKADNPIAICEPIVQYVGASTSRNSMGLYSLLTGLLYHGSCFVGTIHSLDKVIV